MAKHRAKGLTNMKPPAARGKSLERGGLGAGGDENLLRHDTKRAVASGPNVVKSGTITLPPGSIPSPSGGKSSALDFTHALMQGNPVAMQAASEAIGSDTILGSAHNAVSKYLAKKAKADTGEELSLADEFVAATFRMGKGVGMNAHQQKRFEPAMAAYRADMKFAHRFVLDDDFVRYATEISSTISAEKLLARLQYATLPYPVTWIEYNLPVKVRTMRRIHQMDDSHFNYDEVGERLGYLLHRLNDTDSVCQIICQSIGDQGITAAMIAYYMSLTDREWGPLDGENVAGTMPMSLEKTMPGEWDPSWIERAGITQERHAQLMHDQRLMLIGKAALWGFAASNSRGMMLERVKDLGNLGIPSFLARHGEAGYSRMFRAINSVIPSGRSTMESMADLMGHETTEFAGTMRWVVVVLSMLNEIPLDVRRVEPRGQFRVGLTGKRRMLDYHRLTLRLPKTNPVAYIERKFRQITKRRAHEVRAHWRTYLHDRHCRSDEHQWVYDYDNGYRLCGVCDAYGRMIHEHVRGDPSLGWVDKQYVIKKDKQS